MAKTKSYDVEKVSNAIEEYFHVVCRGNRKRLIMTEICKYLNSNGFPEVNDRKLNRDNIVKAQIEEYKKESTDNAYEMLITYNPLNVEEFIKSNGNIVKLKRALELLDNRYSNICQAALTKTEEVDSIKIAYEEKSLILTQLMDENRSYKNEINNMKSVIKELSISCQKYRDYFKKTLLPEIANEVLRTEKRFSGGERILSEEGCKLTISSNDNHIGKTLDDLYKQEKKFKNPVVVDLFNTINKED